MDDWDDESPFSLFLEVLPPWPLFFTLSFPVFSVFVALSDLLLSDAFTTSFFTFKGWSGFFFFLLTAFAILSSPKTFCIIISKPEERVSFTTMTLGDLERLLALTGDVTLFSDPEDDDDFPGVELSFLLVSEVFSGVLLSFSLELGAGVG